MAARQAFPSGIIAEAEKLKQEGKCPSCKGFGKTPDGRYTCTVCNGTGKYQEKTK